MPNKHTLERRPWTQWYKLDRWKQRRIIQLRAHPLCVYCQRQGIVALATVVDHVVPHHGNAHLFWHGALQSLCKQHHDNSKQSEDHRGYTTEVGLDGVPIDPKHPANRGMHKVL
jgi:5-methylcytosine-specific restriction enzyme A